LSMEFDCGVWWQYNLMTDVLANQYPEQVRFYPKESDGVGWTRVE